MLFRRLMKGESSYFGFGIESDFGEFTSPGEFWKVKSANVDWGREMSRKFLIAGSPKQSEIQQRAWTQKGEVTLDADPDALTILLYGIFGKKTTTAQIEAKSGGASTTLALSAVAGDDEIEVNSATGLAVNDIVAIGAGQTAEFATVTGITGTTISIEAEGLGNGLLYGHSIGSAVVEVVAPVYKHVFDDVADLPSFTWELDLGSPEGSSAARFSGMVAEGASFSYQAMEPINVKSSFVGSKMSIHNTTATPAYIELSPLLSSQTTVAFDSQQKTGIIKSMTINIGNGLEQNDRTLETGIFASKGSAGSLSVDLSAEALFESDTDLQRFLGGEDYEVGQQTSSFPCVVETVGGKIGTTTKNYSLKFTMPKSFMTACSVPIEVGRRIAQSWRLMGVYDEANDASVQIELTNGRYI